MANRESRSARQFVKYIGPVIEAVRELGGSGRPDEVRELVARRLNIPDEEQSKPLPSGVQTRFENQVHWARFYSLKPDTSIHPNAESGPSQKKVALLGNPTFEQARQIAKEVSAQFKPRGQNEVMPARDPDETDPPTATSYREEVAVKLQALPPAGFERFCQRLLRESGFQEVTVTGRSGDGGIDGIGILQVNVLVSFKVLFQCKRYAGAVTPSHVRDFRGAMMGRADKGIIIPTGSFTSDARKGCFPRTIASNANHRASRKMHRRRGRVSEGRGLRVSITDVPPRDAFSRVVELVRGKQS